MNLIFTSYASSPEYNDPAKWLERIAGYTGMLESLSQRHNVIGIERINYEGTQIKNSVQYYFIRLKSKVVYFPFGLHRLVKKLHPDIVFINGFIFPLQIIQLRLKLGKKVKIIVLHRAEKPGTGIRKILQRIAARCINAYFFVSSEMGMEWVEKGIIKNKEKIMEVIQASSIFYAENKPHDNLVFLWVGRLDDNKDPLTVIKAFLQFVNYQPLAKLYMVYQSQEILAAIKKLLAANPQEAASIKLVSKVPHSELQQWYNKANFIISGSHYEGSGIAVVEGMSCGCIPIVTNIQSFSKMTGPGKCGFLYEAGNDEDLLAILLKTATMNIEEEKNKTLQQSKRELSFEAIAKKVNNIIAEL